MLLGEIELKKRPASPVLNIYGLKIWPDLKPSYMIKQEKIRRERTIKGRFVKVRAQ